MGGQLNCAVNGNDITEKPRDFIVDFITIDDGGE